MALPYISVFIFVIGLCLGSFFNVLADRLPDNKWPTGRSHCDFCGTVLKWMMLIPIVSYLVGWGRSICCGKKLSYWYPVSEVLTAVLYVGLWNVAPLKGWSMTEIFLYYIILSSFIVIFIADVRFHIIPDVMTAVFTVCAFFLILGVGKNLLVAHIGGGILLFGMLYILYAATKGKGMGFGDVKFAFPMGLLLGPVYGLLALYISFMIGGIYGTIALITGNKKLKSSIAFGPFLIIGTIIMIVWGREVLQFVHSFLG